MLLEPEHFTHPHTRLLAETVARLRAENRTPSLQNVLTEIEDDGAKSTAVSIATRIETETESRRVHEHWRAVLQRINHDASRATGEGVSSGDELAGLMGKLAQTRESRESFGSDTRALPGFVAPSGRGGGQS